MNIPERGNLFLFFQPGLQSLRKPARIHHLQLLMSPLGRHCHRLLLIDSEPPAETAANRMGHRVRVVRVRTTTCQILRELEHENVLSATRYGQDSTTVRVIGEGEYDIAVEDAAARLNYRIGITRNVGPSLNGWEGKGSYLLRRVEVPVPKYRRNPLGTDDRPFSLPDKKKSGTGVEGMKGTEFLDLEGAELMLFKHHFASSGLPDCMHTAIF